MAAARIVLTRRVATQVPKDRDTTRLRIAVACALGPDHASVATNLNNLASLYDTVGDYAKAEPLYKRALAIREKALGPDHPDVANILRGLAGVHRAMKRIEEAEKLELRAAQIRAIER